MGYLPTRKPCSQLPGFSASPCPSRIRKGWSPEEGSVWGPVRALSPKAYPGAFDLIKEM